MKVALYIRVSTADQNTALQHDALMEYVSRHKYNLIKVYEEKISSAKKRPQYLELLNDAKNKQFDAVIVYSFDRFSRSLRELIEAFDLFKDKEISFISLRENIDTTTHMGKCIFHILGAFSELNRSIIVERVKEGLAARRKRGLKMGKPFVIDRDEVKRLRLEGLTYRQISGIMGISIGAISEILNSISPMLSKKIIQK